MTSVAVVGAGRIGSRHLQALARLERPIHLSVVDPFRASLDGARSRYDDVATGASPEVTYFDDITALPAHLDVVIVATTADRRRAVVEELFAHADVRFLVLEKVLFQTLEDHAAIGRLLADEDTPAWVNHTRRMWPGYDAMGGVFAGTRGVEFRVVGPGWDLGCNAVHFLDLLAFLVDDTTAQIDDVVLERGTLPVSRAGFEPFSGWIAGRAGDAAFRIGSDPTAVGPIRVEVKSDTGWFRATENSTDLVIEGEAPSPFAAGAWSVPPQSQLSDRLVVELLERGNCALTRYDDSARLHVAMLSAFLDALSEGRADGRMLACPIT
jgi:Oxidoreductase family, NAD-binding Rossmann fold